MRVLLAPDKFKGSLTAAQVANHLGAGLLAARPDLELFAVPIADGGDGTVDAAVAAGFQRRPVRVSGPTGQPVATSFALRGDQAVVELADACGLVRLPGGVPAPMTASSAGLGETLRAAVHAGATTVVLGIGGSASTDGGAGMLTALGAVLLDAAGRPVGPGGGQLSEVHRVELSGLDPALAGVRIRLATDVDNPLLGPNGAAAVYGPQKGASPAQVRMLDDALARWASVLQQQLPGDWAEVSGAGAAGGVGFAALAALGAQPFPGIDLVLAFGEFTSRLAQSDAVITGEGSLDAQTLQGKGPAGVAAAATAVGLPVLAVAGRVLLSPSQLRAAGFSAAWALQDLEPDPAVCMAEAGPLLEALGRLVAAELPAGRLRPAGSPDPTGTGNAAQEWRARASTTPSGPAVRLPESGGMEDPSQQQSSWVVVASVWDRIAQRDWTGLSALLAPDVRVSWPGSGETFSGAANFVSVQSEYPEGWEIRVLRIVADGDLVVSEVEVPHVLLGDIFRAASFWTVRDGLVVEATEYWVTVGAEEPPDWRRPYAG